jgi:hypothetical protein
MIRKPHLVGLALAIIPGASSLFGDDPPKTVQSAKSTSSLPKELAPVICFSDLRRDRLIPLLKVLEEKTKISVAVDHAGIKKACGRPLDQIELDVPRSSLPMAIALELVAAQVHGTLVCESGRWSIKHGTGNLSRFLSAPNTKVRAKYLQPVTIKEPIQNIIARDVFEFLSEKYEISIVDSPQVLDRAKVGRPSLRVCTLPSGTRPLNEWIKGVASQIGAEVQEFEELILVVPVAAKRK